MTHAKYKVEVVDFETRKWKQYSDICRIKRKRR